MRLLALALALRAAPPVDMTWRADESCPVERFDTRLAAYLTGASEQRPVTVTADIRHVDSRWTADLVLVTADGRSDRHLAGAACAEVADAAAFVTAVVVDPGVLARPPPDPEPLVDPAPRPGPGAVPDPPSPVPAPARDDTRRVDVQQRGDHQRTPETATQRLDRPRRPGGFVRLSGGLEALGLPRLAPTAHLAAGLLGRRWRVELGAAYRAPTTIASTLDPNATATIRLWSLGLRGCGVLRPSVLEIPLCAGLEAGQAFGRGGGYDQAAADRAPWLAAVLGPALAWAPRRWFAVWLGLELGLPIYRARFVSAGLGEFFRIAPVSLRAGLGLEFRFFN